MLPNLVPGSDMAGEIISLGDEVKGWKIGDRVSPNFWLDHIHGASSREIQATALGAAVHGVLTQYKIVPAHVSFTFFSITICLTYPFTSRLLEFPTIFHTKRLPLSRMYAQFRFLRRSNRESLDVQL